MEESAPSYLLSVLVIQRYLPKLLVSFGKNHCGELQQADNDGAFAVVVLLYLSWAEV